jgi:hypothetical protein
VDDQPIFVAAEIEDDSVVAHEVDGAAELPLYFGRVGPMRLGRYLGRYREPRPNWACGDAPKIVSECEGRSPA